MLWNTANPPERICTLLKTTPFEAASCPFRARSWSFCASMELWACISGLVTTHLGETMYKRDSQSSAPDSRRLAVLYARVSSKEQEKEGYSIPAQIKLLRDHARVDVGTALTTDQSPPPADAGLAGRFVSLACSSFPSSVSSRGH